MSEAIKLTLAVDGAAEAKKAVEGVTSAIAEAARASEDTASASDRVTAGARRIGEDFWAKVDARIAKRREESDAAKKATAAQVEGLSEIEKQAKRAADQVERLALARGKSDTVAHGMGDQAFEAVFSGRMSAGRAVWNARAGFAAEKAALRELAEEAARAEGALPKVGGAMDGLKGRMAGLTAAGRLLLNAFLPDMWVARTISAGRALGSVITALSASTLALGGVVGGASLAAWLAMRSAWKEDAEAGEKLARTIERQNALQEEASRRGDLLRRTLGPAWEAARDKAAEAERESARYADSLERVAEAADRAHDAERRRIDLAARSARADLDARYQPALIESRRAEDALRAERHRLDVEFRRKTREATSPETQTRIADEYNAKRDDIEARITAVRADRDDLIAKRDRARAVLDRDRDVKVADADAAHAVSKAATAAEKLAAALDELTKKSAEWAAQNAAREKLESEFRAHPQLAAHAGVLGRDSERRKDLLDGVLRGLDRDKARAEELDKIIAAHSDDGRTAATTVSEFVDDNFFGGQDRRDREKVLRPAEAERARLGDPTAAAAIVNSLLKSYADTAQAQTAGDTARRNRDKLAADAESAGLAAADAKRLAAVVRKETGVRSDEADTDRSSREQSAAARHETETDRGATRATVNRDAAGMGAAAAQHVRGLTSGLAAGDPIRAASERVESAIGSLSDADGATKGDLENFNALVGKLLDVAGRNAEVSRTQSSEIAALRANMDRANALLASLSGQIRAAR